MTGKVVPMPDPAVVLDLDAYETPEDEVLPPYVVKVGGKNITFLDPGDIEWRLLASIENPGDMIRVSLSKEDREHIREQEISGRKFGALMKGYYDHYGLEDKIAEAKRQAITGL